MKRLIILATILAALAIICFGQYKPRISQAKIIQLPEPKLTGRVSLEQVLATRRSVRQFTDQQLSFVQIGQLAWAGQGITEKQRGFRTAPSAGALYPMKLYFVTPDGMFVYHPEGHNLEEIFSEDIRDRLSLAALGQEHVADAACDIIIAGSVRKLAVKYHDKARRYMLLEAGHISENILLQAVSLELGCVPVGAFDISDVHKLCKMPGNPEPLLIVCVGYPDGQAKAEKGEEQKSTKAKRAVLIIASKNFRDEELFETKRALGEAAVETVIASTKTGVIKGMLGGKAEAEIHVNDIVVDDYDAIIFVGGVGAREYFNNRIALNIAREAVSKGKVLAAICVAPGVLADAGVLDGVRATSFSSERIKLIKAGAKYTGADVERDGLIITGSGPKAASQFGKTIVQALQETKN
jgi:protease I